ncbi:MULTISPECIES: hypothetical protein [Saccharopolyspora]|uniref:Secreted protein n=1 Tax=Saccharopolyspora elongata TaxID=2530387 RepID=A0A4V2YKS2_9PSEU|nr:hypothetical protein [Saccharopolyspora elongata]TDD43327.1 hypothetical protein E1288_26810 [Saccharopolyspora elongata]
MRRLLASTLLTGLAVLGAAGTAAAADGPQPSASDPFLAAIVGSLQGPNQQTQVSHNEQHKHHHVHQHHVQTSSPLGQQGFSHTHERSSNG